jgi:hypothetical protein
MACESNFCTQVLSLVLKDKDDDVSIVTPSFSRRLVLLFTTAYQESYYNAIEVYLSPMKPERGAALCLLAQGITLNQKYLPLIGSSYLLLALIKLLKVEGNYAIYVTAVRVLAMVAPYVTSDLHTYVRDIMGKLFWM